MKTTKVIMFILTVIACVGIVILVVSLAAFKYSEEQTDSAISNNLSLKTGQNIKDLSVTTLVVKEQHDVRVVVFQYNGTGGVETGTAVFSKLPLIPRYRYDRMVLVDKSQGVATVINTGLTQELTLVNGTDITISTAGIGTFSYSYILFVLVFLEQLLVIKLHSRSMKEKNDTEIKNRPVKQ